MSLIDCRVAPEGALDLAREKVERIVELG